jgi:hypothetical protein
MNVYSNNGNLKKILALIFPYETQLFQNHTQ